VNLVELKTAEQENSGPVKVSLSENLEGILYSTN